jgi:hypothetical protein
VSAEPFVVLLLAVEAPCGSLLEPNGFTPQATANAALATLQTTAHGRFPVSENHAGMHPGRCHGFEETDKNAAAASALTVLF